MNEEVTSAEFIGQFPDGSSHLSTERYYMRVPPWQESAHTDAPGVCREEWGAHQTGRRQEDKESTSQL